MPPTTAPTIAVVDYGAGNLNSVKKAFDYLGAKVVVTTQPEAVAAADKIVLPGVGHFSALGGLDNTGLRDAVLQGARAGKPFLGICLGMQWLFEGSDEAPEFTGAGIFGGRCRPFPSSVKSPHVGWNSLVVREARACCVTSHQTPLFTTPIPFKRRWLPPPRLQANTERSFPPSSNKEIFSESSSIRKNRGP